MAPDYTDSVTGIVDLPSSLSPQTSRISRSNPGPVQSRFAPGRPLRYGIRIPARLLRRNRIAGNRSGFEHYGGGLGKNPDDLQELTKGGDRHSG